MTRNSERSYSKTSCPENALSMVRAGGCGPEGCPESDRISARSQFLRRFPAIASTPWEKVAPARSIVLRCRSSSLAQRMHWVEIVAAGGKGSKNAFRNRLVAVREGEEE